MAVMVVRQALRMWEHEDGRQRVKNFRDFASFGVLLQGTLHARHLVSLWDYEQGVSF
jgi:hypothetical protein